MKLMYAVLALSICVIGLLVYRVEVSVRNGEEWHRRALILSNNLNGVSYEIGLLKARERQLEQRLLASQVALLNSSNHLITVSNELESLFDAYELSQLESGRTKPVRDTDQRDDQFEARQFEDNLIRELHRANDIQERRLRFDRFESIERELPLR